MELLLSTKFNRTIGLGRRASRSEGSVVSGESDEKAMSHYRMAFSKVETMGLSSQGRPTSR